MVNEAKVMNKVVKRFWKIEGLILNNYLSMKISKMKAS